MRGSYFEYIKKKNQTSSKRSLVFHFIEGVGSWLCEAEESTVEPLMNCARIPMTHYSTSVAVPASNVESIIHFQSMAEVDTSHDVETTICLDTFTESKVGIDIMKTGTVIHTTSIDPEASLYSDQSIPNPGHAFFHITYGYSFKYDPCACPRAEAPSKRIIQGFLGGL